MFKKWQAKTSDWHQ
jgi:hypothetical protein